jgi:hypothetical protein
VLHLLASALGSGNSLLRCKVEKLALTELCRGREMSCVGLTNSPQKPREGGTIMSSFAIPRSPVLVGEHMHAVLLYLGYSDEEIARWRLLYADVPLIDSSRAQLFGEHRCPND